MSKEDIVFIEHNGEKARKGDGALNIIKKGFQSKEKLAYYLEKLKKANEFSDLIVWIYSPKDKIKAVGIYEYKPSSQKWWDVTVIDKDFFRNILGVNVL